MCEPGAEERGPRGEAESVEPLVAKNLINETLGRHLIEALHRGISDPITLTVDGEMKGMARVVRSDVLEALQRNQSPIIRPLTPMQKQFVATVVKTSLRTGARDVCFRCNPHEWKLYYDWLKGEEWFLGHELFPDPNVPLGKFETGNWL